MINVNKLKFLNLASILLGIIVVVSFTYINQNKISNKSIQYWKNEKKTIIVEDNEYFHIYYLGFWNEMKFRKSNKDTKNIALLISGYFEYNIYYNLQFKQESKFDYINYNRINNKYLDIKHPKNKNVERFIKSSLVEWDSLIISSYSNDQLFIRKVVIPDSNLIFNVFCDYIYMDLERAYSPNTSDKSYFELNLYLPNGRLIREFTKTLPKPISKYLFKTIEPIR